MDLTKVAKSKGHIGFTDNGYEYLVKGSDVYRAHYTEVFECNGPHEGKRFGRWECSVSHFKANISSYNLIPVKASPVNKRAKRVAQFRCLECGKKYYSVKAAERASYNGCTKCGGVDIDIA
jgi:DNA-directed RNA polymerase subunit RPC12/RpoP